MSDPPCGETTVLADAGADGAGEGVAPAPRQSGDTGPAGGTEVAEGKAPEDEAPSSKQVAVGRTPCSGFDGTGPGAGSLPKRARGDQRREG